jgi:hypothetical protein
VKEARARIVRGLQVAEAGTHLQGNVAILRVEERPDSVVSRYAPYVAFPNAYYSVMCSHSAGVTKITAMRNPWIQFDSVPLGPLLAQFGGGGHDRVASVELRSNMGSADQVLKYLVVALQSQSAVPQPEGVFA